MSLFGLGKKKKEVNKGCGCNCECSEFSSAENKGGCCLKPEEGIDSIKVLGTGCASCRALYINAQEAIKNMGLNIEVEYITDVQKIMEYGVMSTPAIVVNDKVISSGRVLKTAEIEKLLNRSEI